MSEMYRGNKIELDGNNEYVYSDNKQRVKDNPRPCGCCGKVRDENSHDGCIGVLRWVMNACCGHGETQKAYIQLSNGFCVRGQAAIIIINVLKRTRDDN